MSELNRWIVPALVCIDMPGDGADVANHEACQLAETANLMRRHLEETLLPTIKERVRLVLDEDRPTVKSDYYPGNPSHLPCGYPEQPTDTTVACRLVLEDLLSWAASLGGWEAPAWNRAKALRDHLVNDPPHADGSHLKAVRACSAIVAAYKRALDNGGEIDWCDLDDAYTLATQALVIPVGEEQTQP